MTRKQYENEDDESYYSDADVEYDSELEYVKERENDYEEYQQNIFEEQKNIETWNRLINYPQLYHLKNLSYCWFEELLETGIRPEQFQAIFIDEIYEFPVYEPVPSEIENFGITQEVWDMIR